ncbi:hypothetical protein [Streptomyces puniciscabiei]|uniref:hypothetical protein n=1 Tax=Streptomyces puniciscabiei TaxID=164348 RepID=UPI0037AC576D
MASGTGIHCTNNDKSACTYLADALDTGHLPSFDAYAKAHLDTVLHTPVALLTRSDGNRFPDLDTAARAHNRAYSTVVTDAPDVSPALSPAVPFLADAEARVAGLAAGGPSYISTDVITAPANGVLGEVIGRG